uniref:Uncharacterized protein n=1 Tax=Picea sitchensis TaxID=3332 RepID=B8LML3_PICSI|nr:unknown [Picea sitchensis]
MLEALGCIPKYLSWNTDSNFTLCNASYLELLHRKSGYEVPCNQSIHTLFHTNRYGSGRKLGRRIMAKVGRRDEELGGGGDERTQDLLVEIAMLEAQKVQVIEFVKERSSHLAEIVEQANSEFQQVADDTMKGMDEAGIKVMENIEADIQACEEKLASARAEIETNEQSINKFEKETQKVRNEGLFFQSLYTQAKKWKDLPPEKRNTIQMEAEMLKEVTKRTLNSTTRRNVYICLILVLSLTLIDLVASGNAEWPKPTIYTILLVLIFTQLIYETSISSNGNNTKDK